MKQYKTDSVSPVADNCKTVYEIAAPFIMHFFVGFQVILLMYS